MIILLVKIGTYIQGEFNKLELAIVLYNISFFIYLQCKPLSVE